MSEVGGVASVDAPLEPGGGVSLTAGQLVRNAREAAGLHVAALAVLMKIPVKKLEALESDRLDLLHDAVFVRALASSVCRTLKIDPAPVLSRLPGNTTPRLHAAERGINAPFRTPGEGPGVSLSALLSKPVVLIVGALLAGVVIVGMFPDIDVSEALMGVSVQPRLSSDSGPGTHSPVENVVVTEVQSAEPTDGKAQIESPTASSPAASASEVSNEKTVPGALGVVAVNSSVASAPVASVGLVVFKARGTSWIKVVDANGTVQLSKTLTSGETASASGVAPLSVVVGRSDVTDVEVRGKSFSMAEISRDNVARFEVK
jgi:cytoskeleton protein RodZ